MCLYLFFLMDTYCSLLIISFGDKIFEYARFIIEYLSEFKYQYFSTISYPIKSIVPLSGQIYAYYMVLLDLY